MRLRATRLTSIAAAVRRVAAEFSPASLFANGEQGWWYDPSNFSTLYQDSAGTTPVTAVEQPVGLQLDLSKGLVLGPQLVTNGDFATDTWWSKGTGCTISGGSANFAAASGYVLSRLNVSGIAVGGFYEVTFTVTNYVSGSIRPYLGATPTFGTSVSANGTYTVRFGPTAGAEIGFNSASAFTGSIDNVSIKAVAGNHRFQTTSANRPVVSARVNLLTKTEEFDNAAWTKSAATITANAIAAPDGTTTADKLVGTAATDQKIVRPASLTAAAGAYKLSCYMKAGEFSFAGFSLYDGTSYFAAAGFNLSAGTVTSTFGGSALIEPAGNGWYLCSVTGTAVGAIQAQFSGIRLYSSAPAGVTSNCVGDGTSGIYIWGADLRHTNQGVNLPAYQRVNTSTDYDSTGFPVYIKPNGSNQFMQTNSINFTATDKMTVWQGVRKLNPAVVYEVFAELSTNVSNSGAFLITGTDSFTPSKYAMGSTGTILSVSFTNNSAYTAPITNVITGIGDIAGDVVTLRVNGTQVATSTTNQGTGNYGNYPAYFYARAGTSLFFNGNDYGSIARGAASTAAQITAGETYINSKTKAY